MTDTSNIKINPRSLADAIANWMVDEYIEWRDDDQNNPTIDADAPLPTLYQVACKLADAVSQETRKDIEHL